MDGVIVRLFSDKKFGFIKSVDNQIEHFFHQSALIGVRFDKLKEGQQVDFEPIVSEKGPRCGSVRPKHRS